MIFYLHYELLMKKLVLLWSLSAIALLAWCTRNKLEVNLDETNFDVDVCNTYFDLIECVIENEPNDAYTPEIRDNLKAESQKTKASWLDKDSDELEVLCSSKLSKFEERAEEIAWFGCTMN